MNKEEIFKNIPYIKAYRHDITDSFDLYFGQNKNNENNCLIEVKGFAYYNCETPKQLKYHPFPFFQLMDLIVGF